MIISLYGVSDSFSLWLFGSFSGRGLSDLLPQTFSLLYTKRVVFLTEARCVLCKVLNIFIDNVDGSDG